MIYYKDGAKMMRPVLSREEYLRLRGSAEQQRLARIGELRTLLAESDYKAIKYAEGWITAEDYAEVKAQRQAWRDEINELEG